MSLKLDESLIFSALAQYGIPSSDIVSVTELPSGINHVFLIETNSNKFILKEYIKLKSPQLEELHTAVVKLMLEGFSIPEIITNENGEYLTQINGHYFDLSLFIKHIDHSDQIHISPRHLQLAGKTLAQLQATLDRREFAHKLLPMNFAEVTQNTLQSIEDFKLEFRRVSDAASSEIIAHKLNLLLEIIQKTEAHRKNIDLDFTFITQEKYIPTHGDFSMVNTLFTHNGEVYVIDWDELKMRPRVWDVQAAASLFSAKYSGNAFLIEPDKNKLKQFLDGYTAEHALGVDQLMLLSEVAQWNFSIYWLSYTLPAVLLEDFRLLSLIPENAEQALFWPKHLDEYKDFLANLS